MKTIQEISHGGLVWVNVSKQGEKELAEAGKRFGFEEQDLNESLPPFQRPKIVKRANYYFMILHFPVFDRETKRLGFMEIDFFLSANCLVTAHNGKLPAVESFFEECRKHEAARAEFFSGTAVHVLFELLHRLLDAIFPILLHVNEDINAVDKRLFGRLPTSEMAEEILRLKTNVVTFRRTMQGHRTVLERLIMYSGRELDISAYRTNINSLREYTNEIWHMLESQKESINALHETNESLVSLRTNEIMKTLTVISVITFPLTLLATIFSIQAKGTPFINGSLGFWIILFLISLVALAMVAAFKRKKWM